MDQEGNKENAPVVASAVAQSGSKPVDQKALEELKK